MCCHLDEQDDANHSCLMSHIGRMNIVENLLCICLGDYETIDHAMWSCERYDSERQQLWNDLRVTGTAWETLVRDLLGCKDWRGLRECCSFLKRSNLQRGSKLNRTLNSFARDPRKERKKKKTKVN
jgi:hypothetical protein